MSEFLNPLKERKGDIQKRILQVVKTVDKEKQKDIYYEPYYDSYNPLIN